MSSFSRQRRIGGTHFFPRRENSLEDMLEEKTRCIGSVPHPLKISHEFMSAGYRCKADFENPPTSCRKQIGFKPTLICYLNDHDRDIIFERPAFFKLV